MGIIEQQDWLEELREKLLETKAELRELDRQWKDLQLGVEDNDE